MLYPLASGAADGQVRRPLGAAELAAGLAVGLARLRRLRLGGVERVAELLDLQARELALQRGALLGHRGGVDGVLALAADGRLERRLGGLDRLTGVHDGLLGVGLDPLRGGDLLLRRGGADGRRRGRGRRERVELGLDLGDLLVEGLAGAGGRGHRHRELNFPRIGHHETVLSACNDPQRFGCGVRAVCKPTQWRAISSRA